MTIRYALLTKKQANQLDPLRYNPTIAEFANLRLNRTNSLEENDTVAVVAFDGERIVGKILFGYGWLPFDNTSIRLALALAQDLLVSEEYRGRGIGLAILQKSTEIKVPQIHSGLSGMALPLIEKLGFLSIDRTPSYQLALSAKGLLRLIRADFHAHATGALPAIRIAIRSALSQFTQHKRLISNRSGAVTLSAAEAIRQLPFLTAHRERRFQIPWNNSKLIAGVKGVDKGFAAWVISVGNMKEPRNHLVTAYLFERHIRIPLTNRLVPLSEWRVNEIYPPVKDHDTTRRLIPGISANLSKIGADVMELFAPTEALVSACTALGLVQSIHKSMLLVPSGVSDDLKSDLLEPSQWWCRALNENQFEESQPHFELIVP